MLTSIQDENKLLKYATTNFTLFAFFTFLQKFDMVTWVFALDSCNTFLRKEWIKLLMTHKGMIVSV